MKLPRLPLNWKRQRLSELVAKFEAGVSVNGGDRPAIGDECGILKISAVTEGQFRPNENKVIEGIELRRACLNPKRDSLIMSRANTPELVGASAYIDRDYPNLYLSDKLWQFVPHNEKSFSMRWLGFVLASHAYRKKLGEVATGSSQSMKNISQESVLQMELPVPPITEQQYMAKLLAMWESAIEKSERLIVAKTRRNEALSNRLLFGHARFRARNTKTIRSLHWFSAPSDWQVVEIGKVAREVSALNGGDSNLPVLSCTKYDGLVDSLTYFDKQIFSYDTSKYKVARHGQFAYATNHIEEGSIGYQHLVPAGLVSPIYTVFQTDSQKIDDGYFYKLLKTEKLRQIFAANTNASVARRGSLRWKEFARIHIPLPPLEEQREISAALNEAKREILLLQAEVAALKTQKRGLMQKLLTGQWRIKTQEEVQA